jgi:Flp pilus assembly protein TadD
MRSRVREKAGDADGASRDWDEGMRQEPRDEKSWIARGMARLAKDTEGALGDFNKAVECSPRSLPALQNVAHALSKLDRNEDAVKALEVTIRHHPDYVPARIGRGVILARLGRRDEAHQDAEEVLLRDNKAPTLYQAACIYALTSRKEPADRREAYRLLASALWKGYDSTWSMARTGADSTGGGIRRLADGAAHLYASTRARSTAQVRFCHVFPALPCCRLRPRTARPRPGRSPGTPLSTLQELNSCDARQQF